MNYDSEFLRKLYARQGEFDNAYTKASAAREEYERAKEAFAERGVLAEQRRLIREKKRRKLTSDFGDAVVTTRTEVLVWHGNKPQRGEAQIWRLTNLLGPPVLARVQHQDGKWMGQVLMKGPAKGLEWHDTRNAALLWVEKRLAYASVPLFGAEELKILIWDEALGT